MDNSWENIRKYLKTNGRNISAFVLSLLLAFGIWVLHSLSLNYTNMVSIAVTARSNLDGYARLSSNTAVITARCRATGFDFYRMQRSVRGTPLVMDVDPGDLHHVSGDEFSLTGDAIERSAGRLLGNGTNIESVLTDSLRFVFPKENSKRVPVHPNFSMTLRPQYVNTGAFDIEPDSVTIYGEPYKLENIDRVYTEPLHLQDLDKSVSGEIALEKLRGIRCSAEKITYSIEVVRYVEIEADMPVSIRNVPPGKRLTVYPGTVKVFFRCAFPVTVSPQERVHFYIDYNDYLNSLSGQCVVKNDGMPVGVIGFTVDPEVFECIESGR